MTGSESIYADVVIVGSGAGGATLFERLTAHGIDVLLIEEGSEVTKDILELPISDRIQRLYRNSGLSPVLGLPPIAYGEGRALGGTTEVNGGLLWKPPPPVLADWINRGLFPGRSDSDVDREFERIRSDLSVIATTTVTNQDLDSTLLVEGALKLGWSSVPAQRAVRGCQRKNQCGAGCPSGAKQSMSQTYIPRGITQGGRILTETKAIRLMATHQGIESIECVSAIDGRKIRIYARDFFLAAGTIHSAALMSTLSRSVRKYPLGLHLNAKTIAEFPDEVNAINGTIFTEQIQTFIDEGILMMATNFGPEFLALTLSTARSDQVQYLTERINHLGLYTVQTRPQEYGTILGWNGKTLPTFNLKKVDAEQLVVGTIKICQALFDAGATSMWLPLSGLPKVTSIAEAIEKIKSARSKDWQLSTVHAMSSLALGHQEKSEFDCLGKHKKWRNLYIADASALPTTVGESPQGSIMLLARSIAEGYIFANS